MTKELLLILSPDLASYITTKLFSNSVLVLFEDETPSLAV